MPYVGLLGESQVNGTTLQWGMHMQVTCCAWHQIVLLLLVTVELF